MSAERESSRRSRAAEIDERRAGEFTDIEKRRVETLEQLLLPPEIIGPDERRSRRAGFCAFFYDVKTKTIGKTFIIVVYVDETAMDADPASLPSPLRENVETLGRAAVEASICDGQYPKRIFVDASGARAEGEHVARFYGLWLMRLGVGAAFGYALTLILTALDFPAPYLGWLVALVPIYFKTWLNIAYPVSMRMSRRS
jgi:hypothetical protein